MNDPVLILEGLAQSAGDTIESEGILYSIGYVIPDVALSILGYGAAKGALKGADAAADTAKVANALDDIGDAAKAADAAGDTGDATKAADDIVGSNGIPTTSITDLPENVQSAYAAYTKNGWKGNTPGQTPGTGAGGTWDNALGDLPTTTSSGEPIKYREFDVNSKVGATRDSERFVVGSDGSVYYTKDHYESFILIE